MFLSNRKKGKAREVEESTERLNRKKEKGRKGYAIEQMGDEGIYSRRDEKSRGRGGEVHQDQRRVP